MSSMTAAVSRTDRARLPLVLAAGYVLVWIAGLLVAPPTPPDTAPPDVIGAFYRDHPAAVLAESALVHGLAGLALVGLGAAVAVTFRSRFAGAAGAAAGVASLVQVGLAVVAAVAATGAPDDAALLRAINLTDSVKLVLLAGFVAATALACRAARWYGVLSTVVAAALLGGAASFLIESGPASATLAGALAASLVGLLGWALTTGVLLARAARGA